MGSLAMVVRSCGSCWLRAAVLVLLAARTGATDLDVRITSGGAPRIEVSGGESVAYRVEVELTDARSDGLALVLLDLAFEGGALEAAEAPEGFPLAALANPAGPGGTVIDGRLVQLGGGQDTSSAARGALRRGLGAPGAPLLVATGRVVAPAAPGRYRLELAALAANVLRPASGGTSFVPVDAAGPGTVSGLTIVVRGPAAPGEPGSDTYPAPPAPLGTFQPRLGEPFAGLSAGARAAFEAGRTVFDERLAPEQGLGPAFNDESCGACHNSPAVGGFAARNVIRFGRRGPPFDALEQHGGPLLQLQGTEPATEELIPPEADMRIGRLTNHLFGAGLVDSLPDETLAALARSQPEDVRGAVNWVTALEDGRRRAGRFGWKAQIATLTSFTAEAARDELGLTNRLMPEENAPGGAPDKLLRYDRVPDPEDVAIVGDPTQLTRVERFIDFQRLLAPPPQTPRSGLPGEASFERIGCAACHVPEFTAPEQDEAALSHLRFRPYSDFLLHDMGALGDGVLQGEAGPSSMRTAPLWGLGQRRAFLHDGREVGHDFAVDVKAAIEAHDGQGRAARAAFAALPPAEASQLIEFLRSLGRADFDFDLDNDIDDGDAAVTLECVTGPEGRIEAPERAAIADVDQDGDVDLADLAVLQRARSDAERRR